MFSLGIGNLIMWILLKKGIYQYCALRNMVADFFADSEYKLKFCLEIHSFEFEPVYLKSTLGWD